MCGANVALLFAAEVHILVMDAETVDCASAPLVGVAGVGPVSAFFCGPRRLRLALLYYQHSHFGEGL